ncbi:MAG: hypothetical protein JNK66_12440 [Chitinophagales bacterium]|nr:hypothetical protein [Chitinophagales bacterium]
MKNLLIILLCCTALIEATGCREKTTKEICNNGLDDDNDGFTDLNDNDCTELGSECLNGNDDDGDGFTDSADLDCTETGSECSNGVDDDQDGFTDCNDVNCTGEPGC